MLVIALIGIPVVLAYTVSIYWIFRGKSENGAHELPESCNVSHTGFGAKLLRGFCSPLK